MKTPTPAARVVARLVAIALWIVGSAYLIRAELDQPAPDMIVIAATPIVWLVVIALPILAHYAWREREWAAAALLFLAALTGSAYTVTGTVSRQAEARDVKVARADDAARDRRALEKKLGVAEAMLAEARRQHAAECRSGKGKRCDGISATLTVYEGAVDGYRGKIARLDVASPVAGERRVAAALSYLPGVTAQASALEPAVGLFLPALLGLTLELAALAAAMYGWHARPAKIVAPTFADSMQTSFAGIASPAMFVGELPEPPQGPQGGPKRRQKLPANVVPFSGRREVVAALTNVAGPVNNGTLARLMGVTDGEASRRWREAEDLLDVRREGREVLISLKRSAA